jgi:hypothetical protein
MARRTQGIRPVFRAADKCKLLSILKCVEKVPELE